MLNIAVLPPATKPIKGLLKPENPNQVKRRKSVRFSEINEERIIPNNEDAEDVRLRNELFEINTQVIEKSLEEEEGRNENGAEAGIANAGFDIKSIDKVDFYEKKYEMSTETQRMNELIKQLAKESTGMRESMEITEETTEITEETTEVTNQKGKMTRREKKLLQKQTKRGMMKKQKENEAEKKKMRKRKDKVGVDNANFNEAATEITENIEEMKRTLNNYEAQVENDMNEKKVEISQIGIISQTERHEMVDEGVRLAYSLFRQSKKQPSWKKKEAANHAKKSYDHLIVGDIIVGFRNANLHQIAGYATKEALLGATETLV